MKKVINLSGILFLCFFVSAQKMQGPNILRALMIGDTIPDVSISNIYNYKSKEARFYEFKGKLVIIDFWFGACPGCIESFSKLEFLQKKFGEKVQILMVNYETQEQIDLTFKKWHNKSSDYRLPKLISVVSDTLFHKLFPHQYYPHEVWIDADGVVKAFTSTNEVNEANITAMLARKEVNMEMKIDNLSFDDFKYPILSQIYSAYPDHLRYYSVILNFIPGISGGLIRKVTDSSAKTVRISRRNMTILQLFTNALDKYDLDPFESPQFDFGKRVILQVKDSNRYFFNPREKETRQEWQRKNCYTYESVLPLDQTDNLFAHMFTDLEKYFHATCTIEKRKMKCWSLVRTSTIDKIRSKEGKAISVFDTRRDTTKFQLYAGVLSWLIEKVSKANRNTPYIFTDKTGYTGRIDVELEKKSLSDLAQLKAELRNKYDLDLIQGEEEVEVMVFKEIK